MDARTIRRRLARQAGREAARRFASAAKLARAGAPEYLVAQRRRQGLVAVCVGLRYRGRVLVADELQRMGDD